MSDKKPIYAGTRADRFAYAKEFESSDGVDSKNISYDTIGNNYLVSNNISDNIDTINDTFVNWKSSGTLATLHVVTNNALQLYPCATNLYPDYNIVVDDSANGWDETLNQYTIPVTGYYNIHSLYWVYPVDLGLSKKVQLSTRLFVNDSFITSGEVQLIWDTTSASTVSVRYISMHRLTTIEYLQAGDVVKIAYYRYAMTGTHGDCVNSQTLYTDTSNFLNINMIYAP